MTELQYTSAKKISDEIINFLDASYHPSRLAGSDAENMPELMHNKLWQIETTLAKEAFIIGQTAVYKFFQDYFSKTIIPMYCNMCDGAQLPEAEYSGALNKYYAELNEVAYVNEPMEEY